jgi:BCD family chlorophyll transporter-like MFS transporter
MTAQNSSLTGGGALSWGGIVRLGLVQSALGALAVLATSTLNRVMVVEIGLPAALPAALVAWQYAVQLSRPRWGHGSDLGHRRTPWIIGGMGVMAMGAVFAADAVLMMGHAPVMGFLSALVAFTMIGAGGGASGTSLLALLATKVAPDRRPAAASLAWILMILGIVISAGLSGKLLQPFSEQRLALVCSGVAGVAFLVTLLAVWGAEGPKAAAAAVDEAAASAAAPKPAFRQALAEIWADPQAKRFTIFVFVSMLAYSAQELILEPFAGLVFGLSPGQSTQLTGLQHGGVLLGMIVVGLLGARFGERKSLWMRRWTMGGCIGSALALGALALACLVGPAWPLAPTVFVLGLANGVFAVSAIGSMGPPAPGFAWAYGARLRPSPSPSAGFSARSASTCCATPSISRARPFSVSSSSRGAFSWRRRSWPAGLISRRASRHPQVLQAQQLQIFWRLKFSGALRWRPCLMRPSMSWWWAAARLALPRRWTWRAQAAPCCCWIAPGGSSRAAGPSRPG